MEHRLYPAAKASIRGADGYPHLRGKAQFYPWGKGTLVRLEVEGLPHDGFFALHIHSMGDCSAEGGAAFSSAGGHLDPAGQASHPDHAGDLPDLLSCGGYAFSVCYTQRFSPKEVTGRAVMIHLRPDDHRSQPAGDSGARIACGVIRGMEN